MRIGLLLVALCAVAPARALGAWSVPRPLPGSFAFTAAAAPRGGGVVLYGRAHRAVSRRVLPSGRTLHGHTVRSGRLGFVSPVAATGPLGHEALAWAVARGDDPIAGVAIVRGILASEPVHADFVATTPSLAGPALSLGADRTATVAWIEYGAGPFPAYAVKAVIAPPYGRLRPVVLQPSTPGFAQDLQLGSDDSGRVTATWVDEQGQIAELVARRELAPGGPFGATQTLAGPAAGARILTDGGGDQTAVWSDARGDLEAAVRAADGPFGVAHPLGRSSGVGFDASIDAAGRVLVAWRGPPGATALRYAFGNAAGDWTAARQATRLPGLRGPQVALDDHGSGLLMANDSTGVVFARAHGLRLGAVHRLAPRRGDGRCTLDRLSIAATTGSALALTECNHAPPISGTEPGLRVATYRP